MYIKSYPVLNILSCPFLLKQNPNTLQAEMCLVLLDETNMYKPAW